LLRAAEAGNADSQYNLGILCDNGLDDNEHSVAGSRRQAVKWLLAAAEQGLPRAQVKLAEVYADAPDILGSHAAAGGWFLLAALELHGAHLHRARSGYERIASHLNPAQIEQARRFAQGWTPKRPKPAAQLSPKHPDGGGAQWMADDPGEELLARNMVDTHGAEAATIVRANARGAAVAGQPGQAKSWIRVLGMIQHHQTITSLARLPP
jgi:TPR repeat protein